MNVHREFVVLPYRGQYKIEATVSRPARRFLWWEIRPATVERRVFVGSGTVWYEVKSAFLYRATTALECRLSDALKTYEFYRGDPDAETARS